MSTRWEVTEAQPGTPEAQALLLYDWEPFAVTPREVVTYDNYNNKGSYQVTEIWFRKQVSDG